MINNYKEALEKYFIKEAVEDYSLDKSQKALEYLGNPLKNIKVIHIAGTNGKGSVSKMLFSVLTKSGFQVGVYTQPSLLELRERFLTNSGIISKKNFVRLLNKLLSLPIKLAFFEKSTLMAFMHFEEMKCDYVIIETGLGGLLDTTNIVLPYITAITSIGYDHQRLLGNTLEEISFQKAGIIKEGIPIVYNHENKVIENAAKQKNAQIIFIRKEVETNLKGDFQKRNAGVAFEICKYIGIKESIIYDGLISVEHPGRLDYLERNLLIDGAHNKNSFEELKKYISGVKQNFYKIYYIFSLKEQKDIKIVTDIFGKTSNYILVNVENNMLESVKNLETQMNSKKIKYELLKPKDIIKKAKQEKNNLFVVFGSLYMIGEFYK